MTRCPRCQRRLAPGGECRIHGVPSGFAIEAPQPFETRPAAPAGWRLSRVLGYGGTALASLVERDGQPPTLLKIARWRDSDIRARFEREVQVLQSVGPPATPAYHEHGISDGLPYIIMEYLEGETLASWMAHAGNAGPLSEILAITTAIAAALELVHARGFVHRDIKPENVIVGTGGIRVIDFGLAKPINSAAFGLTKLGTIVGTAHYLAPEQVQTSGNVDQRADVYSLGVVLFEMIAGRPPFVGDRRALEYMHVAGRAPMLRELREVPAALDELVVACMAKHPQARPGSAKEVRDRIGQILAGMLASRGTPLESRPATSGHRHDVVLAWITNASAVDVAREIAHVAGAIVRADRTGVLAAFTPLDHDAPIAAALAAGRALATGNACVVVHVTPALVRRGSQGKIAVYGDEVERVATWVPARAFAGVALTAAAAKLVSGARADPDLPNFHRERPAGAELGEPGFFGRDVLVDQLSAWSASERPMTIAVSGPLGVGKTRLLSAIVERLRASHNVVEVRGRRKLPGERRDDERLVAALGAGGNLIDALASTAAAGVVLAVDDVDLFSPAARDALLGVPHRPACILTSTSVLFEVDDGDTSRVAVSLPALSPDNAQRLVRSLLQPARLIPDELIERLVVRGAGNPGHLVALARDLRQRGAIRRSAGCDDWYVAANELDTLLVSPPVEWSAERALDVLPAGLQAVLRVCGALGPRFQAPEVIAAAGGQDIPEWNTLVDRGFLAKRGRWYEFADPLLQDALYLHSLDDRAAIHLRAMRFWLGHHDADAIGRLARIAHHATGAEQRLVAAGAWLALARAAARRGEQAEADDLLGRASESLAVALPATLSEAIAAVERSTDE